MRTVLASAAAIGVVVAAFTTVACMVPAQAAAPAQARIGWLQGSRPQPVVEDAFLRGLRDLGYVDGADFLLERHCCANDVAETERLVANLLASRVHVIVVSSPQVATAARAATRTVPIVLLGVANAVELGLAKSLGRPGGNVTGISPTAGAVGDMVGKHVDLLKQIVPRARRLGVLINPTNPIFRRVPPRERLAQLGSQARVELEILEATAASELPGVFERARAAGVEGVVVTGDALTLAERALIAELALKHRLPTSSWFRASAEAGSLLAYGTNFTDMYRRAATYVDRILKGARPADMPIEQAMTYQLIVNMKTARALGLTIPFAIHVRADAVLE